LLIGQLTRDFIITPQDKIHVDIPGGNLIYAAVGLSRWDSDIGLVSRIGEDYPRSWLAQFDQMGFDTQGIHVLPESHDVRSFMAYTSKLSYTRDDPVGHFARLGIQFPKALLGYRDSSHQLNNTDKLSPLSIRESDIPDIYRHARSAHICPIDFLSHSLLPAALRVFGVNTITLDPSAGYMHPAYWDDVLSLLSGLTAFMPTERKIRDLFRGRSEDLWEMAAELARFGCDFIVIRSLEDGVRLYDSEGKNRWHVPVYPSEVSDPTGMDHAFCGGFLAGYKKTYDPVNALLYGCVSESLIGEGSGPFYPQNALPELTEARLTSLKSLIRMV
jgi:sugar/nucleoside kinase (ribokinase family)